MSSINIMPPRWGLKIEGMPPLFPTLTRWGYNMAPYGAWVKSEIFHRSCRDHILIAAGAGEQREPEPVVGDWPNPADPEWGRIKVAQASLPVSHDCRISVAVMIYENVRCAEIGHLVRVETVCDSGRMPELPCSTPMGLVVVCVALDHGFRCASPAAIVVLSPDGLRWGIFLF